MKTKNVLVIGSGGREASLVWKLLQSPQAGKIYAAPGNPGMQMNGCQTIPIAPTAENFPMLCLIASHLEIDLVVVGPDNCIAEGIEFHFRKAGIPVFSPSREAAQIEWSKVYAKELMKDIGIPTANFTVFREAVHARNGCQYIALPLVVKEDGLGLGKGARVCRTESEARQAIDDFMVKKIHGKAGEKILIENFLEGKELSIHVLCDGIPEHAIILPPVRDHKQLTADPDSPMTGGMGVFGPIDVSAKLMETIRNTIILPVLRELSGRGTPFVGLLYPGLMLTEKGPMVLEFNARWGDPECQWYMRHLHESVDLIEVLSACTEGRLDKIELQWNDTYGMVVTLATPGYPDNPKKNLHVWGRTYLRDYCPDDVIIFHAGTYWSNGEIITSGGRIFSVSTEWARKYGPTHRRKDLYELIQHPVCGVGSFEGMQYRTDIGQV